MFSIFKKTKAALTKVDFSGLRTDMHSHLVPGIDDGSPEATVSVALINGMQELGFSKFITTPHTMWDMYQNTPATIQQALVLLKDELSVQQMQVDIQAASEYFLDDHFEELLEANEPLLTFGNNYVLVEFSFVNTPINFKEVLFKMQIKGYQPVLAHPERYLYCSGNRTLYDDLKSAGCLFQVNLLSLAGYYGKGPAELAAYLINKQYVNLLGTDLHHERHLDALRNSHAIMNTVQKLLDSGKILNPLL